MAELVFPVARWVALAWLAVWLPAYLWHYGPNVFLNLCDIAVILTCLGLWRGSPLLLSSQALASLVVDVAWDLDLVARVVSGRHLVGGTEYMWDSRYPLWLRLLSLFHLVLPVVLLWSLRRVGYDRRALPLQSALAAAVLAASRLLSPEENQNFAYRDPFFDRAWGPAPVHLAVILGPLLGLVYWPLHRLFIRLFPPPAQG